MEETSESGSPVEHASVSFDKKSTWIPRKKPSIDIDHRRISRKSMRVFDRSEEILLFDRWKDIELPSTESCLNELQSAFLLVGGSLSNPPIAGNRSSDNSGGNSPLSSSGDKSVIISNFKSYNPFSSHSSTNSGIKSGLKIGISRIPSETNFFRRNYEKFLEEIKDFLIKNCGGSWAVLFHNRMKKEECVMDEEDYDLIVEKALRYQNLINSLPNTNRDASLSNSRDLNFTLSNLPESHSKINSSLLNFLQTHGADPDNSLIGLNPSRAICKTMESLLSGKQKDEVSVTKDELVNLVLNLSELKDDKTIADKVRKTAASIREQKERSSKKIAYQKGDLFIVKVAKRWNVQESRVESIVAEQNSLLVLNNEGSELIIARYWGETAGDLLQFYVSPLEEKLVKIPKSHAAPMAPETLMGSLYEEKRMEKLVANPTDSLYDNMYADIDLICSNWLYEQGTLPNKKIFKDWSQNIVSIHSLNDLKKTRVVLQSSLEDIPDEVIDDVQSCIETHLDEFHRDMHNHKFFPPKKTHIMTQLGLFQADPIQNIKTILQRYYYFCEMALEKLEDQMRKIKMGNIKADLTNWWLTLIKTRVDYFLETYGYDHQAVPSDYTSDPPQSMSQVKKNIQILRRALKSFNALRIQNNEPNEDRDMQAEMDALIKGLLDEIYPVLDEYVITVGIILHDYFNIDDSVQFDPEAIKSLIKEKEEELGEIECRKLEGLVGDIIYIQKMKLLEDSPKVDSKDIVPVTGLIMGRFIRFENEAETVVELWDSKMDIVDDIHS